MTDKIILKPSLGYWFLSVLPLIVASTLLIICSFYIPKNYASIGKIVIASLLLVIICMMLVKYIRLLICTKWIITEEQIFIKEGIFTKSTDFIELYRVTDYGTKTQLYEAMLGIHNLYVHSGDKTRPILHLYGIKDIDVIQEIRARAEAQKKKKQIYEFTNR